jgi:hypothetical protein
MEPPIDMITADGYDLQFGTNVIGHRLFTGLLMPDILADRNVASRYRFLRGRLPHEAVPI